MRTSLACLLVSLALGCTAELGNGADSGGDDGGPVDAGAAADAGPVDAGSLDSGPVDAGPVDAGPVDAGPPPPPPPADVFFVGNSFTFGGPVPTLVEQLAIYAGFPEPNVEYRAIGGQTLEGHRADEAAEGAPARVREGWDVVVLQEYSTGPTDAYGTAEQFKLDATWFYDLAKAANPGCEVILYETWARRFNHAVYPLRFADPAQMQAELRFHYNDAADVYIPAFSTSARPSDVRVAPAGDAWEIQLASGEPPRLHASDDYHASAAGAYLNALVIYGTVFRRRTVGLVPLRDLDEPTALLLQASADRVTGSEGWGFDLGPYLPIATGATLSLDLGPLWIDGWTPMPATRGTVGPLGAGMTETSVRVTAWGFSGEQTGGSASNDLGLPAEVAQDTLWVGSFDGHAAALALEARVVVRGLPTGRYRFEMFASRTGTDGGNGRLTRYRVGEAHVDLDASDNRASIVTLTGVSPDAHGEVVLRVGVSPEGGARFAYLGALTITREE